MEAFRILWNSQVEPRLDIHPAWTFSAQPGYPVFVKKTAQGSPDHCPSQNLPVSPSQLVAATEGRGRVTLETVLSASSIDFLTSSPASLAPSSLASSNRTWEAGMGSTPWSQPPFFCQDLLLHSPKWTAEGCNWSPGPQWSPGWSLRLLPSTWAGWPYCYGSQPWTILSLRRLLFLLLWCPESEPATILEGLSSALTNAMPASGHQFARSSLKKK